jgi:hypothetical protein
MNVSSLENDPFYRGVKMDTQIRNRTLATSTTHLLRQMLVVSHQPAVVQHSLIERAKMVRSIADAKGIPVPILGTNPLFDGVKLVTRTTPNWAFYNLSHDPLWKSGKFPIPRRHLRNLNRLYRGGVEFDALYVAHELPVDFDHENDRLEPGLIEPAPPKAALGLAQRFGVAADGIVAMYAAAIRQPIQTLAVIGTHGSAILRDPILMGAVIPPGVNPEEGVPAVWFLLAAWRW